MPSADYVYGINPAFEVARAGKRRVLRAYMDKTTSAGPRLKSLAALLAGRGAPIELVEKGRLSQLCGSREHQGVALQVEPYPLVPFESALNRERVLLIDNVEDPQNVGAMLRSAESLGWRAVLLPARGAPAIYASVVKAAAGATEYLEIARDRSANAYARALLDAGFTLIALDVNGREDISTLRDLAAPKRALIVGGEHRAVGQFLLNNAQHVVRIPRRGKIESLNASVAAGIAMFLLA